MDAKLTGIQGVIFEYSQPILDNVNEAVAGLNANNAIKIFGDDLNVLDTLADKVITAIKDVRGIKELEILRNLGQPEISIHLNKQKMAIYGVAAADCQAIIEMAIGGKAVTQLYEGEKKFDIRIRYSPEYRKDQSDIGELKIPTVSGTRIPLKEIADIKTETGPAFIYRDLNKRLTAISFAIRGRDLGSTIKEAQETIDKKIKFPKGYSIGWTGEFESEVRAINRLTQIVPICIIFIFILLFMTFGNIVDAGLVLMNVPFALIGGILALHATGTIFGISAGVGFIALFGICVQNGVILVSVFKKNLKNKLSLDESIHTGVSSRIRPVVMTALMAAIGFFPRQFRRGSAPKRKGRLHE